MKTEEMKSEGEKFHVGGFMLDKETGKQYEVLTKNLTERTVVLIQGDIPEEVGKRYSFDEPFVKRLVPRLTVEAIITLRVQVTDDGQPKPDIQHAVFEGVRETLATISRRIRFLEAQHGVKVRVGDGHLTEFAPAPLNKILI